MSVLIGQQASAQRDNLHNKNGQKWTHSNHDASSAMAEAQKSKSTRHDAPPLKLGLVGYEVAWRTSKTAAHIRCSREGPDQGVGVPRRDLIESS